MSDELEFVNNELLNELIKADQKKMEEQYSEIEDLRKRSFSTDDIIRILKDVGEEVVSSSLDFGKVVAIAKDIFKENISLVDGWDELYKKSKLNIQLISYAMENESVSEDLIDNLDSVENDVLIKYYLIKNLKVLFFNKLAQDELGNNIEDDLKNRG